MESNIVNWFIHRLDALANYLGYTREELLHWLIGMSLKHKRKPSDILDSVYDELLVIQANNCKVIKRLYD